MRNASKVMAARAVVALGMSVAALTLVGCGGGSAGGAGGTGTIFVTVTHAFGEPAARARVGISSEVANGASVERQATADAAGKVTFANVRAGDISAWVEARSGAIQLRGTAANQKLVAGGEVSFTLVPAPIPWMDRIYAGQLSAVIVPGGIAADGRRMTFDLELIYDVETEGIDGELDIWMGDCGPTHGAPGDAGDCVLSADRVDVEYVVGNAGRPARTSLIPGRPAEPLFGVVLIDQSSAVASIDPTDTRLYNVKYFLGSLPPHARFAVAAFASSDPAMGDPSALPSEPVTFLSASAEPFATPNAGLYGAIDALADQEGGAAPVDRALTESVELLSARAPANARRAILLLTTGDGVACVSGSTCAQERASTIARSRAAGVSIVPVVMRTAAMGTDDFALNDLAVATGGVVHWTESAGNIGLSLLRVGELLDGRASRYVSRFSIESGTAGAFVSGRTVQGRLNSLLCAWGCWETAANPVAIEIP